MSRTTWTCLMVTVLCYLLGWAFLWMMIPAALGVVTTAASALGDWCVRDSARQRRRLQLLADAEYEHAALMRGEVDLGVYGRYPPARCHNQPTTEQVTPPPADDASDGVSDGIADLLVRGIGRPCCQRDRSGPSSPHQGPTRTGASLPPRVSRSGATAPSDGLCTGSATVSAAPSPHTLPPGPPCPAT